MYTLATTRFTNSTWETNQKYRENNNISGCIYGSPQEMSPKILYDSLVFVVEMNNDSNTIEGIGMVRNRAHLDKYYNIYKDGNYNRFVYKSNYRLDRNKLLKYNRVLVEILDYILFYEKSHLKRGCGFTTITPKFLASKIREDCKKLDLNKIINTIIGYFKKEYSIIDDIRIEETDEKIVVNIC
jgi:hypothetical protein